MRSAIQARLASDIAKLTTVLRSGVAGVVLAAVMLGLASTAAEATSMQLLVDPSFEDQINNDPNNPVPEKWALFDISGASAAADNSMPRSGTSGVSLNIQGINDTFAGVLQDVSVTSGDVLTFTGYHKLDGSPGGTEIRIEFLNSGVNIGENTPNLTVSQGANYEQFSLANVLVPTGADTARVVYAIQSYTGTLNQKVFVDDFSLTAVPLPAAAWLFGTALAGLFGAGRYRRKAR